MSENPTLAEAEALYQNLWAAARHPKKRNNLELLREVLREQINHQATDFSIVTIARLLASRGGPREQTLRNKTGEDFRVLIKAYAQAADGHTGKPRSSLPRWEEELLERLLPRIDDATLRAQVQSVIVENRSLKRQMDLLQNWIGQEGHVKLYHPFSLSAPSSSTKSSTKGKPFPSSSRLTPVEWEALVHFISPDHLEEEGWARQEDGRLTNRARRSIARVGFVTGLEKLLTQKVV